MGGHAEYTAAKAGVSREDADAFSYASHMKAVKAMDEGLVGHTGFITVARRRLREDRQQPSESG